MNLADPSTSRASPRPAPKRSPTPEHIAVFEAFESYRFSDDPDFRAGLPTVIGAMKGTKRTAAQVDDMMGRAQWFYFTRLKHVNLPWESYRAWSTSSSYSSSLTPPSASSSPPSSHSRSSTPLRTRDPLAVLNNLAEAKKMMDDVSGSTGGDGEQGMSFGMLCRLISEGRAGEVPVKQIPDQLNTSPPSDNMLPIRPKPWERGGPSSSAPPFQSFTSTSQNPSPPHASSLVYLPQSTSTPSLHVSPSNSISISQSPRQTIAMHHSPPSFDPSSLYRQNSDPIIPLPPKQNPSPPGTSSSFNNPSLAPSPPALNSPLSPTSNPFDFSQAFNQSQGLGLQDSTDFSAFQNLSMNPPSQSETGGGLGHGFAMSPFTFPSSVGLFDTPKDESMDPLAVGVGLGDRGSSQSGDIANLNF